MSSSPPSQQDTLRVAIAGAGITGLSTALALVRHARIPPRNIHIYEPRNALDAGLGAAVNLNGGAAILEGQYHIPLRTVSTPISVVLARSAPACRPLYTVDIPTAVQALGAAADALWLQGVGWGGGGSSGDGGGGGGGGDDVEAAIMTMMRSDLQALLADAVLADGVSIRRGAQHAVRDVRFEDGDGSGHRTARLVLADGTVTQPYDLVVGADGVRSNVRRAVLRGVHDRDADERAAYTGFRVIWALRRPGNESGHLPRGALHQWFGDGAYVLHYGAGPRDGMAEMIALSFRDGGGGGDVRENIEYEGGVQERVRQTCAKWLRRSGMPREVVEVFEGAEYFIETGVYAHKAAGRWCRDGVCILVGDAAHAMAPYLGQGANQGIQDAQALALALRKAGAPERGNVAVEEALREYERVRRAPTEAIVKGSTALGLLETQGGIIGTTIRNGVLGVAGGLGLLGKAFVTACIPRVQ